MDVPLIEDDAAVWELLAEMLGEAELRMAELPDGECLFGPEPGTEAVPPGVFVTDVDLGAGRNSGIEVAARARRRWPDVGVVLINGRPSNLHGRALGWRDRFLSKPFPSASLVQAVAGLLGI